MNPSTVYGTIFLFFPSEKQFVVSCFFRLNGKKKKGAGSMSFSFPSLSRKNKESQELLPRVNKSFKEKKVLLTFFFSQFYEKILVR